jgi:hypothetical protein
METARKILANLPMKQQGKDCCPIFETAFFLGMFTAARMQHFEATVLQLMRRPS